MMSYTDSTFASLHCLITCIIVGASVKEKMKVNICTHIRFEAGDLLQRRIGPDIRRDLCTLSDSNLEKSQPRRTPSHTSQQLTFFRSTSTSAGNAFKLSEITN